MLTDADRAQLQRIEAKLDQVLAYKPLLDWLLANRFRRLAATARVFGSRETKAGG